MDFGSLFIDFNQQFIRVYGMYHSYIRGHVFDFVCLQVADEMPFNVFGQGFIFLSHFLHVALTEIRWPAAYASSNASLGWNLDTATRRTPAGSSERTSLNLLECSLSVILSIFYQALFGFSGIRKFRFHIRFGFVWVNIHDGGFGYGRNHVVCHCTFHSFVQFLYSVAKVGSLYQYGSGGLFSAPLFRPA